MAMGIRTLAIGQFDVRAIIELQSREQVIEEWLAIAGVSARFSSDLQEIHTVPATNKKLESEDSRS
jgi:hypothetical protein